MSESHIVGHFVIDRRIWHHPTFKGDPFSRRDAWLWLISEAAWKPRDYSALGRTIHLERGQLVTSLRFLAKKWGWTVAKVRHFLHTLQQQEMILTSPASDTGYNTGNDTGHDTGRSTPPTLVTICNYNKYQYGGINNSTGHDTGNDTGHNTGSDTKQIQEKKKKESPRAARAKRSSTEGDDWPTDYPRQFWTAYPDGINKNNFGAMAGELGRLRKEGVAWTSIIAGLKVYQFRDDPKYREAPHNWLRNKSFEKAPTPKERKPYQPTPEELAEVEERKRAAGF